ncbi:GNAT family N-acetyltransferase [Saccharospirillum impatiens]|uniref:GNAT family N-acetyltransferase n=1 Tax=Saccharospirillum impatiens TaxID=169438 RepID=UPI000402DDFC|nr:GNAT family N-acetyltransferase [Saccharospirillum impatiens]
MAIDYRIDAPVSADQFIDLLHRSTLAERRPVDNRACIEGMLTNASLTISAWNGDVLVGIARSVTDFHFACYLSDLAVDAGLQKSGIGKQLQALTQQQLGPLCKLILLAAPAASAYYEPLGYRHNDRCWVLEPDVPISGAR